MTRYRSPLIALSFAALCTVISSGCTDLKPVQAQLDDLKSQLSQISPKIAGADSAALARRGLGALCGHRGAAGSEHRRQGQCDRER